ncbi:hypothetical protein [Geofilum rhodophaeum]|uniref:hypothetical protein n=1 Tax=Geofilum rhodophaeum TaxID=1965019 RepID=UPI000B527A0A|nr:hypothetical protein [Geofilum rhodophaeum]
MTKIYFKTVLVLILLNAILTALLGFVSQWGAVLILALIVNISVVIALIFTSYFFLQIPKIQRSKVWSTIFTFLPSLIMIILLTRNLIQLNFGNYRELAWGIDMGRIFKPSHLQIILTGIIIITNYLRYRKITK